MPTAHPKSRLSRLSVLALLSAPAALVLAACGDEVHYHQYYYDEGGADGEAGAGTTAGKGGSAPSEAGGAGAGGEGAGAPLYPDAPPADTSVDELDLDIFGTWGNRYWFAVSDEQRSAMNGGEGMGGPIDDGLYRPGGTGKANWVDHLFVTTAGKSPRTADYGKVQARVVGQYSRFPWTPTTIPNLNIDADQFVENQRIAGYEHLRFSNGQRGSIFRDKLAYDLYRKLDYPAPLATYVWVQSNVWGPQVSIPYTLVERYKRVFCNRYAEQFGGSCPNMWEFVGDFNSDGGGGGPIFGPEPLPADVGPGGVGGPSLFDNPENCQIDECENTRVKELEVEIGQAPQGEGFAAHLDEYIDWPAFQRFQCLSWVLSTSDDTIHAGNNVVLVEREDGKFQYLPYSIDISMGFGGGDWRVGLMGQSVLARGCQGDPVCWAQTLDVCEDVISDLTELDPRAYLQELYDGLEAHGMLRPGDDGNFQSVDSYFEERLRNLPGELQLYREGKFCEYPYVDCNGECVEEWQCVDPCGPAKPLPDPGGPAMDVEGAGGAGAGEPLPQAGAGPVCPPEMNYGVAE